MPGNLGSRRAHKYLEQDAVCLIFMRMVRQLGYYGAQSPDRRSTHNLDQNAFFLVSNWEIFNIRRFGACL